MQLPQPFLASQVEPSGGDFVVLPRAWYPLAITGEEVKASQSNENSGVLMLTLTVLPGHPMAGQSCRSNYNLFNVNPEAVAIAQRDFSALVHALGLQHTPIHDTKQIFNIPFVGEYGPQKNNEKYGQLYACKTPKDGAALLATHQQIRTPNPTPAPPAFVPPAVPVPSPSPAWNTAVPAASAPVVATAFPSSAPFGGQPMTQTANGQGVQAGPRPPWMK